MKKTLIIGASNNPERYAYKAAHKLVSAGHPIVNFGVKKGEVAGVPIINEWYLFEGIDTVTLYIGPNKQSEYIDKIIDINPRRVLFNPGTENPTAQAKFKKAGIEVEEACTLVLLSLNAY